MQWDGSRMGSSPSTNAHVNKMAKKMYEENSGDVDLESLRTVAHAAVRWGPWCSVCAKSEGLKQCGGCGWEAFCSTEHQKQEWPHHKSWRAVRRFGSRRAALADSSPSHLLFTHRCKSNPKTKK